MHRLFNRKSYDRHTALLSPRDRKVSRKRSSNVVAVLATSLVLWALVFGNPLKPGKSAATSGKNNSRQLNQEACDILTENRPIVKPNQSFDPNRFSKKLPFLKALEKCTTLECLHDAHLQPHESAKFNFPHFMVAGWAKSATTSLNVYLNAHPEVLKVPLKEPKFFSEDCTYPCGRLQCAPARVEKYVREELNIEGFIASKGHLAAQDATPQTIAMGDKGLAQDLYNYMPWLKIVVLLREPINRMISSRKMTEVKTGGTQGCLSHHDMTYCLLNETKPSKYGHPADSYYSSHLREWLRIWPRDQFLLVQTEELQDPKREPQLLKTIKQHVGLSITPTKTQQGASKSSSGSKDEKKDLPTEVLTQSNCISCTGEHKSGTPINKKDYEALIESVRPDVLEVVRLIDEYGLDDGQRWLKNWEAVWKRNLDSCVDGMCRIQ